MSINSLEEYKVTLKTVGPVHIGNGNMFAKHEYVFADRNFVGIIDMDKLYQFMKQHNLQKEFESYVLDSKVDLLQWIGQYGIKLNELSSCIKYKLDNGDTALQRGTKISIMEFVKDAYGVPYIPGSSLKGMLRTILLADDIINNKNKYNADAKSIRDEAYLIPGQRVNRNSYMKKEIKQTEIKRFNSLNRDDVHKANAVNDIMSGFIVSDSMPMSVNDLILCQKADQHTNGSCKLLNILRECIRPETDIEFTITIDKTICDLSPETIMHAVDSYNKCYNNNFIMSYSGARKLKNDEILLGGGVGFANKTEIYPMFGKEDGIDITQKIFKNINVSQKHGHSKDKSIGVSPHILKCTKYQNKVIQMGICKITSMTKIV